MALELPPPTQAMVAVLRVFVRYVDEHGYAPTNRELASLMGHASTNTVAEKLRRLAMQGYLNMSIAGRSRAVVVTAAGRELATKGDA